jgi:hypothetical protein
VYSASCGQIDTKGMSALYVHVNDPQEALPNTSATNGCKKDGTIGIIAKALDSCVPLGGGHLAIQAFIANFGSA